MADDEALKADGRRFRFLAAQHWTQGQHALCVVLARDIKLGVQTYTADNLRDLIDERMKNG